MLRPSAKSARIRVADMSSSGGSQIMMRPAGAAARVAASCPSMPGKQIGDRARAGKHTTGPVGDCQVGETGKILPAVPAVQALETVHSQNEHQRRVGKFLPQGLQCVHRIGRPIPVQLPGVHFQAGHAVYRRLQKLQALPSVGAGFLAQSRIGSGQQAHGVQGQSLAYFQGEPQMSAVNGVEGAAEDSDACHSGPGVARWRCSHQRT